MDKWLWNLVNIGCELAGYYMAAITIDWKLWGRKRMQVRQPLFWPLCSAGPVWAECSSWHACSSSRQL